MVRRTWDARKAVVLEPTDPLFGRSDLLLVVGAANGGAQAAESRLGGVRD